MTAKRDLKRRVRERQARTGETYTTARRHVLAARDESATDDPEAAKPAGDTPPSDTEQPAKRELGNPAAPEATSATPTSDAEQAAKRKPPKPIADPDATSDTPPTSDAEQAAKGKPTKPVADSDATSDTPPSDAEQAAKGKPTKPIAAPEATSDTPASTFEGDEVTDPGETRLDTREERTAATRPDPRGEPGAARRWPDEMDTRPPDHATPIDVDEAVDFTHAAAELGMKCQVLMFPKLAERADPVRVLTAVRDALTATQNDPGTEMLRKLVFRGEAPRGLVMLTREPRFRQHVEAGFTGVSSDGRVLAIHVEGHQGIVTALGTVWRNTSTFVLMAPDDFVTKLVMPPGTIQELGARYGVPIPAGPVAPMPSRGSLRGITTRPGATDAAPTLFLILNGRRYPITRDPFVIGRNHASDLQIKDGHISRKHAAVFWQHGAHYLVDLASQAGIEFRGLRIKNKRIEEGDVFSLGEYVLRFTYLETDG